MSTIAANLKKLPNTPGIYFFLGRNKEILYIGKATSLKSRVRSYFSADVLSTRGPGIAKMMTEIKGVDFTKTESVLEALMLEADLIRKFKPKYNVREKDDKSFNCIGLTDEEYPRILLIRRKDIKEEIGIVGASYRGKPVMLTRYFGPFPEAGSIKVALKIIRRIFPYRDERCEVLARRPCFNRQIGLCPGTCTGEISAEDYRRIIKRISLLLSGNIKKLRGELLKDMRTYAKERKFELASEAKREHEALKHIQDVSLIKEGRRNGGIRMEGYDIAHLSGTGVVGVMVVSVSGLLQKEHYRMFNISEETGSGDVPALKEVLRRRFNHPEWEFPKLIVVDGGVAQLNAAREVLADMHLEIPVVAVTKDERHRAKELIGSEEKAAELKKEIIALNFEAHRFALSFQRKKRAFRRV